MCVAPASTHTAVRAGRLCREGISVLFVSTSFLEAIPQSRGEGVDVKTQTSQSTDRVSPLPLLSYLQEFVRRWLLFQTQHVHLFERPALSQLCIRRRRSVMSLRQTVKPHHQVLAHKGGSSDQGDF